MGKFAWTAAVTRNTQTGSVLNPAANLTVQDCTAVPARITTAFGVLRRGAGGTINV